MTYESLEVATAAGTAGVVDVCAGSFRGGDYVWTLADLDVEGAGIDDTRFDGQEEAGRVLSADGLGDLSLSGMTLERGLNRMDTYESGGAGGAFAASTPRTAIRSVDMVDNVADWGAGMVVSSSALDGSRPEVTISDSRIVRNLAYWGGGALALSGPSTVTIENVDLGSGEDDNQPDDIAFFDGAPALDAHEPVATFRFDGVVSVTCVWETRTCE